MSPEIKMPSESGSASASAVTCNNFTRVEENTQSFTVNTGQQRQAKRLSVDLDVPSSRKHDMGFGEHIREAIAIVKDIVR